MIRLVFFSKACLIYDIMHAYTLEKATVRHAAIIDVGDKMADKKQISNPFSTGGGGVHFEAHIIASFIVLMLTGGYAPCLPGYPIKEIYPQTRHKGYNTDDVLVKVENENGDTRKMICQVKHSIAFTDNQLFFDVINDAWLDFKNVEFRKRCDILALITGPVSKIDTQNASWLMEHARCLNSAEEFFENVAQAKFSSNDKRAKLDVISKLICRANNNTKPLPHEIFTFLQNFYLLGYDLGGEEGVVLSLLHSHISQICADSPVQVWGRIVDFAMTMNQNGAPITKETIPDDIIELFTKKEVAEITIPSEISKPEIVDTSIELASDELDALSVLFLISGFNEENEKDRQQVREILIKSQFSDYEQWMVCLRKLLLSGTELITMRNQCWSINAKAEVFKMVANRYFDVQIHSFAGVAKQVLSEVDYSFESSPERHYLPHDSLKHSSSFRMGVAETIAIMSTKSTLLTNCTIGRGRQLAKEVVTEIVSNADWQLLCSLERLMQPLAEAAPTQFLESVEGIVTTNPSVFSHVYEMEVGVYRQNHFIGLLWALEALAWKDIYLPQTTTLLGHLAKLDSGGNTGNRPINTLVSIFLPWHPQTEASIEIRWGALKALRRECPGVAWELFSLLLPSQNQITMGTVKPKWLSLSQSDDKKVDHAEYRNQVCAIANELILMAGNDLSKLTIIAISADQLPYEALSPFLRKLASPEIASESDMKKMSLWEELRKQIRKHRQHQTQDWALPMAVVDEIEVAASHIQPQEPIYLYHELFAQSVFELSALSDWEKATAEVEAQRQKALISIYEKNGVSGILELKDMLTDTYSLTSVLGMLDIEEMDLHLLPSFLHPEDSSAEAKFIQNYIWARFRSQSWSWVESIDISNWSKDEISLFLCCIPFSQRTIDMANESMGDDVDIFWQNVRIGIFDFDHSLLKTVADKLLAIERPFELIHLLDMLVREEKKTDADFLDIRICTEALLQ